MTILGWKRRNCNGIRLSDPPANAKREGAICLDWHSGWRAYDDSEVYEARRHVGVSAEGFHPGVEASERIGMGAIAWGEAFPTPEKARQAAAGLEKEYHSAHKAQHSARAEHPDLPRREAFASGAGEGDA